MRKTLKIVFLIFAALLLSVTVAFGYYFIVTARYELDDDKLVDLERGMIFYDCNGNVIDEQTDGVPVTEIDDLPKHLLNSFIAIEDKRFYSHNGTDKKALLRATLNNVKAFSFKEGASTISQQLIKNTHLTSEKTLKRKLIEIKLSRQLEKKYEKKEILEKYLNTIYFGDNNYGITKAARAYFGKSPSELDINESAALAGLVKAPSVYSPFADEEKCNERKNVVLKEMYEQNFISEQDYLKYKGEKIKTAEKETDNYGYLYQVKKELRKFSDESAYKAKKFNVYTAYNPVMQSYIEELIKTDDGKAKSAIILNAKGEICAFWSNVPESKRCPGSTIKPLLVYAPAYENGTIYPCTKINDEKTDFSGYSPSNYGDKYYGKVTVRESLAKSLNVCAVKLLNDMGVNKSLAYLKKTDIEITENDDSLALALGCTEKGATLKEITAAYGVFQNSGEYSSPFCVSKVVDENVNTLLQSNPDKKQIFSEGTANLINDALNLCVKEGTAKKLSFTGVPLCAKTGTVGDENGNTDAYSVSYNNEFVLGIWFGAKDKTKMDNSVTGGTMPSVAAANIWEKIYKGKTPPELNFGGGTVNKEIDRISYDKDDKVLLADPASPPRYRLRAIFSENNVPKEVSSLFTRPMIETPKISVNQNEIHIRLCQTEYFETLIIRESPEITVYDSLTDGKTDFVTDTLSDDKEYSYFVIAYYLDGKEKRFGEKAFIGKVKICAASIPDDGKTDWWEDDFA